jgi:hypothetical protein
MGITEVEITIHSPARPLEIGTPNSRKTRCDSKRPSLSAGCHMKAQSGGPLGTTARYDWIGNPDFHRTIALVYQLLDVSGRWCTWKRVKIGPRRNHRVRPLRRNERLLLLTQGPT